MSRVKIEIDLDWYGENEKPIGWYGCKVFWDGEEVTNPKRRLQILSEFLRHCKTLATK